VAVLLLFVALGLVVAVGFKVQIDQRQEVRGLADRLDEVTGRLEDLGSRLDRIERKRRLTSAALPTAPGGSTGTAPGDPAATDGPSLTELPAGSVTTGALADSAVSITTTAGAAGALPSTQVDDVEAALTAFRALATAGPVAYTQLADGKLVALFRALGPTGVEVLGELLRDADSTDNRFLAAAVLELLGDPTAITHLDFALNDDDILVRRMASHALATLRDEAAIPALERAFHDEEDWGVRANAAYGLAKLGQPSGVEALLALHASDEIDDASRAAVMGGMADVGAAAFAPVFRPLLADTTAELGYRLTAMQWAANAKDEASLETLQKIAASPQEEDSLRTAARRTIEAIQGQAATD
jgi:hypothetical protein